MRPATVQIDTASGWVGGTVEPPTATPPPGGVTFKDIDIDAVGEKNLVWYDAKTNTFSKEKP